MKMKSICKVCKSACNDAEKRFVPTMGSVCPDCHEFLLYADTRLKRVGIQHVTLHPQRHSPKKEDAQ